MCQTMFILSFLISLYICVCLYKLSCSDVLLLMNLVFHWNQNGAVINLATGGQYQTVQWLIQSTGDMKYWFYLIYMWILFHFTLLHAISCKTFVCMILVCMHCVQDSERSCRSCTSIFGRWIRHQVQRRPKQVFYPSQTGAPGSRGKYPPPFPRVIDVAVT